uniref:Uncharacterized protein n=1 Tax=Neogobius melanostomus TaxID=47308 RepID=A0A8C6TQA3_9GOBI
MAGPAPRVLLKQVVPLAVGVQQLDVLEGVERGHGEVDVPEDSRSNTGCAGCGASVQTEVQVLAVPLLRGVDHLLRHAHGKGEVAAHLPHHNGGANVASLDLHVRPWNLLHDAQRVGPVPLAAVLGSVGEGSGQLVRLSVVHLLIHTLLEVLKDDGQLQRQGQSRHHEPHTNTDLSVNTVML